MNTSEMDIAKRLRDLASGAIGGEIPAFEYTFAADEIERLRELILRASAVLETVDYETDPPMRVVALMDELRAVNRSVLLTPN